MKLPTLRQQTFIDKAILYLQDHRSGLGVAATATGKTLCICHIIAHFIIQNQSRVLVLAPKGEIAVQNKKEFDEFLPHHKDLNKHCRTSGFMMANSFNDSYDVCFGTVSGCYAKRHLITSKFDLVVFDEAHTSVTKTPLGVLRRCMEINPDLKILGVTATHQRADSKTLDCLYDNVFDVITEAEMTEQKRISKIKVYVIDEVEDKKETFKVDPQYIYEKWEKYAKGRMTMAFCSTIEESKSLCDYFASRGVISRHVDGSGVYGGDETRDEILTNKTSVDFISNQGLLTAGLNIPAISCILLCTYKSHITPLKQRIGRGVRMHEGKDHCVILDFGISIVTHGILKIWGHNSDVKISYEKPKAKTKKEQKEAEKLKDKAKRTTLDNFSLLELETMDIRLMWITIPNSIMSCMCLTLLCSAAIKKDGDYYKCKIVWDHLSGSNKTDVITNVDIDELKEDVRANIYRRISGDHIFSMVALNQKEATFIQKSKLASFGLKCTDGLTAYDAQVLIRYAYLYGETHAKYNP